MIADVLVRATEQGAVRVKGAGVTSAEALQRVALSSGLPLETFVEESSPRTAVIEGVASSTTYPNRYPIQMHNEFSYASEWPRYLFFACLAAPELGGETPVADSRRILERLSPATVAVFEQRGLLYERNYSRRSGVPWQQAFGTTDRGVVERHCADAEITFEWFEDDRLTTRQQAPAISRHPVTGERVWFNHCLLFNVRGLEPRWLRNAFAKEPPSTRASNSYFGDGEEIPDAVIDEVRAATEAERVVEPWSVGDLLVLDNMAAAHGRTPYQGERQVLVAMAGRYTRAEVDAAALATVAP